MFLSLFSNAPFSLNRNSLDDPVYSRMQRGELEYLSEYSRELNSLLRLMVHPDPAARPSAAKLLAHHLLNPTITKSRYTHKSELDALSVVLMKTDLDPRWQKM
jgi:hypothetical protein